MENCHFTSEKNLDYGLECSSRLILWFIEPYNYHGEISTEIWSKMYLKEVTNLYGLIWNLKNSNTLGWICFSVDPDNCLCVYFGWDILILRDGTYHVLPSPCSACTYVCIYNYFLKTDISTVTVEAGSCDIHSVFLKQILSFSSFHQVFVAPFVALMFLIMMSYGSPMTLSDAISLLIFFPSKSWHGEGERKW